MSGDDHSPTQAPGGTASHFDRYKALSPAGCNVANWDCVRSTLVHLPERDADERAGGRATTQTASRSACTRSSRPARRPSMTEARARRVLRHAAGVSSRRSTRASRRQVSSRTHCVYWPDWASNAKVELARGIRMDANYYHYPGPWIGAKPGFMNGGGFPMRFADLDGTPIDVYQQNTNLTDESTTNFQTSIDSAARQRGRRGRVLRRVRREHAHRRDRAASGRRGDRRGRAGPQRAGDLVQAAARPGSTAATARRSAASAGTPARSRSSPPSAPARTACRRCCRCRARPGRSPGSPAPARPSRYTVQTIKGVQYALFDRRHRHVSWPPTRRRATPPVG